MGVMYSAIVSDENCKSSLESVQEPKRDGHVILYFIPTSNFQNIIKIFIHGDVFDTFYLMNFNLASNIFVEYYAIKSSVG